ncbi:MAG TPA: response regulator transcription factor [Dissulfurispiraceae bacterium]
MMGKRPVRKSRKKILVIEDDREIRESLGHVLGKRYSMILARGATEGTKMLALENVGLVILDYVLPDSNGLEVLKHIKKTYPSIPVLFVTGYGNEDICQMAFRSGARDYIRKPFEIEEILSKVDVLMRISNNLEVRTNRLSHPPEEVVETLGAKRPPSHILRAILDVKDYIDENFSNQISLTEAAGMASMSRTYFCDYFKRITGYSLRDYYNYIRVERAKEMLREGNRSIAEISAAMGYNSVNYFIEAFRKVCGYSPADFKRRVTGSD